MTFNSPTLDETSQDTNNMQDEEKKEESTQDIQFDSGYRLDFRSL